VRGGVGITGAGCMGGGKRAAPDDGEDGQYGKKKAGGEQVLYFCVTVTQKDGVYFPKPVHWLEVMQNSFAAYCGQLEVGSVAGKTHYQFRVRLKTRGNRQTVFKILCHGHGEEAMMNCPVHIAPESTNGKLMGGAVFYTTNPAKRKEGPDCGPWYDTAFTLATALSTPTRGFFPDLPLMPTRVQCVDLVSPTLPSPEVINLVNEFEDESIALRLDEEFETEDDGCSVDSDDARLLESLRDD
jgi:hypothetical protein